MKKLWKLSLIFAAAICFDPLVLHSQFDIMNHVPFAVEGMEPQVEESDSPNPAEQPLEGENSDSSLPSLEESSRSTDGEQEAVELPPFEKILNFWFGSLPGPTFFPQEKRSLWLGDSPEEDRQMLDMFSEEVQKAARGDYNNWRLTPRGRLALILLLDQFPRHMYRSEARQFRFDRMAAALAVEGIKKGDDRRLYPIERAFFYLPLEHAENLQLQDLSVASYERLAADAPEGLKGLLNDFLQGALQQRQEIILFGRFPRRNSILDRETTAAEKAFLVSRKKNHDKR